MTSFEKSVEVHVRSVLYCRVSSRKQTSDGSGLDSQEHRCRQYAAAKGYEVAAVFPDDVSGGGDFMQRPGMVALLKYLDAHPGENFVVIFDDLKRYSRDTEFHLKLRREMMARNATRECLNFNFENSPEGKFFETIVAATGTLEREQNTRQVIQKMKARVEQGFWVFRAPVGYCYVKSPRGGKELVADEPLATTVREALEGYASGHFATQTEVKRFLESKPEFPKDKPNGEIRQQTIIRFLNKEVYAGLVAAPKWGVSTRQGHHEGLISLQTFERIRQRLSETAYAPQRKDINADFPLRGAVSCACCDTPLTAGWCKGKNKKYPYYFCRTKGCDAYAKTIRRGKIEGEFAALLASVQPATKLVRIASAMFGKAWDQYQARAEGDAKSLEREIEDAERQIGQLVERIMDASNGRVIAAYEMRIDALERQKLILEEKAAQGPGPRHGFDDMFEHATQFLASPCKLWETGRLDLRRLILKLAFPGHLTYCRSEGFLNTKLSIPFSMLGSFSGSEGGMVPPA